MVKLRKKPKRIVPIPPHPDAAGTFEAALQEVLDHWDNTRPEHVEEKIFEAISQLSDRNLVQIDDEEHLELSGILDKLFSGRSDLVEKGERFQLLTNGYLGDIEWGDMEDAYYLLDEIVSELREIVHREPTQPKLASDSEKTN